MLAEQAPASSTWVAGGLYRLVRRDFVWGDAPMLELQGAAERNLPRHMRLHSLLRPLTRDERLQEMAHAASDLIGRNAELADLHAALHRVSNRETYNGHEGLAARVIYGEMGIGKTALVSTFLSELNPDVRVLRAEGSPARSDLPYAALGEWVSQLTGAYGGSPATEAQRLIADILKDTDSEAQAEDVVACLAELVSSGAVAAADEADAMHNRRLIATGLRGLLDRVAAKAPIVLVLETAQWCDRQTLEVVSELHHLDPSLPILLIVVSRPDDKVMTFTEGLVRMELRRRVAACRWQPLHAAGDGGCTA